MRRWSISMNFKTQFFPITQQISRKSIDSQEGQ